jgi:hypothetical protein
LAYFSYCVSSEEAVFEFTRKPSSLTGGFLL